MRGHAAVAVLALVASGCALPVRSGSEAPGAAGPLRAYIAPPGVGGLGVHLSRPAYAALFEIVPGGGTSLVFPAPGTGRADGFLPASAFNVTPRRRNLDLYHPAWSHAGMQRPRFFFLIASDRPLRLSQLGSLGMGLRSAMGPAYFAAGNPYLAMERLVELTLPSTADHAGWATDFYVHWPEVLYDRPGSSRVLVSCGGLSMYVPLGYVQAAQRMLCAAGDPEQRVGRPGDPVGEDSTGVEEPRRRRPVPAQTREAVRERIASSTQLQRPRGRDAVERQGVRKEEARPTSPASEPGSARPRARRGSGPGAAGRPEPRSRAAPGTRSAPRPQARPAPKPQPSRAPETRSSPQPKAESTRPERRKTGKSCDPCRDR